MITFFAGCLVGACVAIVVLSAFVGSDVREMESD